VKYRQKTFSLPSTEPTRKTPCAIHHFVKGKCLRCDQTIVTADLTKPWDYSITIKDTSSATVPTDSEGPEA
jgi:hypothetical protein